MKLGQVLHGYRITTRPSNRDAGKCMWAFAEKDGHEYFVKEFLDPKRPGSMASPEDRERLLAQCAEFERRHTSVMNRLDPEATGAGNLVIAKDFFFEKTRYYKITERLHPADVPNPHELSVTEKRVLLLTLMASLWFLHEHEIVHGDVKPDNILLHRPSEKGFYTAKLIDFDDAYVSGDPKPRDEIGGDPVHGAPEWLRYMRNDRSVGPGQLTAAADVFGLALIVHRYLTGAPPAFPEGFASAGEAVSAGAELTFDRRLHPDLSDALRQATSADPRRRPAVGDLRQVVDEPVLELRARAEAPTVHVPAVTPVPRGSRLRINLTGSTPPPQPQRSVAGPRLRINLNGKETS